MALKNIQKNAGEGAMGSFSLILPVAVGLIWSFLVRNLGIFEFLSFLPRNIVIGGLIAAISLCFYQVKFQVTIRRQHVAWFFAFFGIIAAVNWHVIKEALACDELYHVGMSSIAGRTVQKFSLTTEMGQLLGTRPMPESVSLLSFFFMVTSIAIAWGWTYVSNKLATIEAKRRFVFFGIWIIATLVGQMCRTIPERVEVHPPLRLFPLFLAQTVFGYDDLSFRVPGMLLLALVATLIASFVHSRRIYQDGYAFIIASVTGLLVCLIPTVAHAATIVEPSIWCFGAWLVCFILLDRYLRDGDDRYLIASAVVVGLGGLMRQNSIVLWPVIGLALLIRRPKIKTIFLTILPGFFVLPYLALAMRGNHSAAATAGWGNIFASFTGAQGFLYIVKASTPPWIFVALVFLIVGTIRRWWKAVPGLVLLAAVIPAYVLYFSLGDFFWSFGRYQAEYIGSTMAILLAASAVHMPKRYIRAYFAVASILGFYSIGVLRTLHYDSNYNVWSRKRITTESMYPYREALGFLHRQGTGGQFVFVGGVPVYGEWLFYLRGFSYAEMVEFRKRQYDFENAMATAGSVEDILKATKRLEISHIIVQWGDRREMQHRSSWQNTTEGILRAADREPHAGIIREDRFYGDLEGALDIYRVGT